MTLNFSPRILVRDKEISIFCIVSRKSGDKITII